MRFIFWGFLLILAVSFINVIKQDTSPESTHAEKKTLPQEGQQFHEVKAGETLGGIAAKYGVDWRQIADWNGIDNPSVIKVGQKLAVYAEQKPIKTKQKPKQPLAKANTIKDCYGYVERSDMKKVIILIYMGGRSLERAKAYVNREKEKMVFLVAGIKGNVYQQSSVDANGFIINVKQFGYSGGKFWINDECLG